MNVNPHLNSNSATHGAISTKLGTHEERERTVTELVGVRTGVGVGVGVGRRGSIRRKIKARQRRVHRIK